MNPVPGSFHASVLRDPLFAAEGMDVARAGHAIDAIEETLDDLKPADLKAAVPLSFLRAVVASEQARRTYLAAPAVAAGKELVDAWRHAHKALTAGIVAVERLAARLEAHSDALFADAYGNTSVWEEMVAFVRPYKNNLAELLKSIEERAVGLASSSDLRDPRAALEIARCEPVLEPRCERALRCEERAFSDRYDIIERHGPFGLKLSLFDGERKCRPFFAYMLRDKQSGAVRLKVSRADDFLFIPLANRERFKGTAFEPLLDAGLSAWYQPGTRFYLSRELRYWTDIATLVDRARRPDLSREALMSQRSSLFDLLLWNAVDEYDHYARIVRARKNDADIVHGFLMHTHPCIFFMPFNRTVWRLPGEVSFQGTGRADSDENPYRPLSEVFPEFSDEEMTRVMRGWLTREESWDRSR